MTMALPKIEKAEAKLGSKLRIKFRSDGRWREVNLAGLIARYAGLDGLDDPEVFAKARVIDWGSAIGWPGDRDIAAATLLRLAEEQAAFSNAEFRIWQVTVKLSNNEAADALGCTVSTIKNYRSDRDIPTGVVIACRAMERDPAVLAAHLIPRKAGRPKNKSTGH
jgi:hypothetical protein